MEYNKKETPIELMIQVEKQLWNTDKTDSLRLVESAILLYQEWKTDELMEFANIGRSSYRKLVTALDLLSEHKEDLDIVEETNLLNCARDTIANVESEFDNYSSYNDWDIEDALECIMKKLTTRFATEN